MRTEAGKGEPLELVDGLGNVHGLWVITEVEETRKVLSAEGVPRRIDFRLQIKRYGEDAA
jgi:phage protein U